MRSEKRMMKLGKIVAWASFFVFIQHIITPAVFASGGGAGGGRHAPAFGMGMVFSIINFLLLIGFFLYVYKKKASGVFEKRSIEVKIEMEEAAEAKRQAEAKYEQYRSRIEGLDAEIKTILETARKDAENEREKLLAEARKQSEKMVQQAELTARQEIESAKRMLRREAAELAARMAEDVVRKSVTKADQNNWVTSYIEEIGELR